MDGADGSAAFNDSATPARTVNRAGSVHIVTSQSRLGGASGYFNGAGDYLTMGDSPISPGERGILP